MAPSPRLLLAPRRRPVRPSIGVLRWLAPCRPWERPLPFLRPIERDWHPVRDLLLFRRLGRRALPFIR